MLPGASEDSTLAAISRRPTPHSDARPTTTMTVTLLLCVRAPYGVRPVSGRDGRGHGLHIIITALSLSFRTFAVTSGDKLLMSLPVPGDFNYLLAR